MEDVLVWWRRKIKVEINPLLSNLSHYREEFRILGRLGHAILFHRSYKNAVNLHRKVLRLFVIVGEYREQPRFGDNVVSIITLEVAWRIKISARSLHHISDSNDLVAEKSEPFKSVARIVNLAIQVMLDKPRLDLTKRNSVDCPDRHHFLSAIEANKNLDAGLFLAVFALESIVNGVDILERREFDYITLGECKGRVGFARLSELLVADTLHTSKLCIWLWKINVYHNRIN